MDARRFAETYDEAYDHIHTAADGQLQDTQLAAQRWLRFLYESISIGTLITLLGERSSEAVLEAIPFEAFSKGLQDSLVVNLTEVVDAAGTLGLARPPVSGAYLGMSFDVTNEEAVAWIEQHAADRVVQITSETRLAIRGIVQSSFTERFTPVESAKRIKEVIGVTQRQATAISKYADSLKAQGHKAATVDRLRKQYHEKSLRYRAESIARTETIDASVAGQQQLWEQAIRAGNIGRNEWIQEWIVTYDDRTCPQCRGMAGKRARVGETFPGDGRGPSLHTRCRCAVVLRRITTEPYKLNPPDYKPGDGTLAPKAPDLAA